MRAIFVALLEYSRIGVAVAKYRAVRSFDKKNIIDYG